jgi:two-component system response regulator YesN
MHCTAEELKNSSLSIREISDKYGFSNQFYFAKAFKKYYSFQPSVYRKNNIT